MAGGGGVGKAVLEADGFHPGDGNPSREDAEKLPKAYEEIQPFPASPKTIVSIEEEVSALWREDVASNPLHRATPSPTMEGGDLCCLGRRSEWNRRL
ncbi:hypothetical protein E2562_011604 [Oryza meyeriana var. granulata]|uniref:Uncharacterized protein n=1 Tax=Oryza meyeriana var. granulata TaxID=110450 RepID=A0A6G1DWA4_9ORYZ|nr:hypothetical protein E2562_011604 [Oryza meyeriana var. granulata]